MAEIIALILAPTLAIVVTGTVLLIRRQNRPVPQITDYDRHRQRYIATGDVSELRPMMDAYKEE